MSFATLSPLLTAALGLPTDSPWITTLVSGDVEAIEIGDDVAESLRSGVSMIVSGKVRVLDGEILVCSLGVGDFLSLDLKHLDCYHLRSGIGLTLLHIPADLVRELTTQHPDIGNRIHQTLSSKRSGHPVHAIAEPSPTELSNRPPKQNRRNDRRSKSSPAVDRSVQFPKPKGSTRRLFQRLTHHYPFIKQQSAVDCGVACLAMVGLHWGKRFDINYLRNLANVDRRGASLKGLMIEIGRAHV